MRDRIQRWLAWIFDFLDRQARHRDFKTLVRSGTLEMGPHTYGGPKVWAYCGSEARVRIGSYCSIAPGVAFVTGGIHPAHWVSTYPFRANWRLPGAFEDGMPMTKGDIEVGCDVWIGTDALVLSGVKIGHGAIVAARAVVTRDVPPYAVVAGAPAKVVKYRFDPATISRMLRLAWWGWDEESIREAVPLLSSGDVEGFLEKYGCEPTSQQSKPC
jgi:acetyltransferase-like isoleucine patch superfamily enzyme